jgi:hypothetical protein
LAREAFKSTPAMGYHHDNLLLGFGGNAARIGFAPCPLISFEPFGAALTRPCTSRPERAPTRHDRSSPRMGDSDPCLDLGLVSVAFQAAPAEPNRVMRRHGPMYLRDGINIPRLQKLIIKWIGQRTYRFHLIYCRDDAITAVFPRLWLGLFVRTT